MDTIFALQRGTKLVELMFRQLTGKHSSYSTTTCIVVLFGFVICT